MPELPEVHTTVEGLKKVIIGRTIKSVWSDFHIGATYGNGDNIKNKKYFEKFKRAVKGAKIISISRKGKNILINLTRSTSSGQVNYTIVVHMKMTGNLMYGLYPDNKFIHLSFDLSDGSSTGSEQAKKLVLSDIRKFASVDFCKTNETDLHKRVGKLGIDALKISERAFVSAIKSQNAHPIKSALMDQECLAGIGNIYSDEILWQAGVHPLSSAGKIPPGKIRAIFKAMKKILRFSIRQGGDSKTDYRNAFGDKGNFQNFHRAYGRKGQRCPKKKCGGIIQRMVTRGRSAHFCPKHQKIYK